MSTPNWSDDVLKTWADAQQNYWSAWQGMMQTGLTPQNNVAPDPFAQNLWAKGLEQWSQAFQQKDNSNQFNDVFQRVVDMGKHYMSMAENAFVLSQNNQSAASPVQAWMDMMENSFKASEQQLGMSKASTQMFEAGQASMQGWQKVLDSMGMGNMQPFGMGNMQPFGMDGFQMPTSENWNEQLKKMLGSATLGYARESQADMQDMAHLMLEYQEAMEEYLKAFAEQGVESINTLRERVTKLAAEGKSISSLRELYDLWVDVNEEVYGKFAMSDRYQVVYGDTVNTLMALKGAMNTFLDDQYKAANLPTRSDMNATLKKQQQMNRENRRLKKQLKTLSRRLDALEGKENKYTPTEEPKQATPEPTATEVDNDDLTEIKGLGVKMSQKLADMGVQNFQQLSEVALEQVANMDKQLGAQGRILRDDWIGQAKAMVEQATNQKKS